MRHFAKPSSLDRLSLEARLVYTVFCLFMLVGYATSVWFYLDDELGTSASEAERYYLGEAVAAIEAPDTSGPDLDIPEDTGMRLAKPARQVMETFHFHLFSVPICLLIVAHIFMMGRESTRTKVLIIGVASASTMIHLLTPPLIRFASPGFAFLMFPSAVLMTASWLYMTASPVIQMWRLRATAAGE
jgi:hypothetical protein